MQYIQRHYLYLTKTVILHTAYLILPYRFISLVNVFCELNGINWSCILIYWYVNYLLQERCLRHRKSNYVLNIFCSYKINSQSIWHVTNTRYEVWWCGVKLFTCQTNVYLTLKIKHLLLRGRQWHWFTVSH